MVLLISSMNIQSSPTLSIGNNPATLGVSHSSHSRVHINVRVIKRSMWTIRPLARNSTKVLRDSCPNSGSHLAKRYYPGDNKPMFYIEQMKPCSNKREIPEFEQHHLKVLKDGYVIGVLTSSPRNKKTGELYHFVSKERHDGSIAPMFNKDGSQNDEGQYISFFKEPRLVSDPCLIGIDLTRQPYFDKYEPIINKLYKIHGPKTPYHILVRVSTNDPMLFHDDGTRDKDF